mgnify:CR=1 FL=1
MGLIVLDSYSLLQDIDYTLQIDDYVSVSHSEGGFFLPGRR